MRTFIDRARFPETVYFRHIGDVMRHEPNPNPRDMLGGHFVGRWVDDVTFENFDGDRLLFPAADANGDRLGPIHWAD